jgi:hypothetical protein
VRQIQPLLAALLFFASAFLASNAQAAATYTLTMNATTPNFGNVASGAAITNFTLVASTGVVTENGTGSFVPASVTSRSTPTTITVNCAGGTSCSNNMTVAITTATLSGPVGRITALGVSFTTPSDFVSGTTSGGNAITFIMKGPGNNNSKSFKLGMTVPIAANGSGYGTAPYTITVTGSGVTTGSGGAAVQANVSAPISISRQSELNFGTLVQIANQTGQVLFPAAGLGNTFTLTNLIQLRPHTIGYYKITGNASSQVSVSISPSPLPLINAAGGNPLSMAVSHTAQGTQFLDSSGIKYFYVGGSISSIPYGAATTPSGAYKGQYTVTVNYP